MELAKIAKGAHKEQLFIKDIESYTKELIQDIKTSDGTFRHDNLTNTKCPHCGKRMLSVKGKNSRMLVCQTVNAATARRSHAPAMQDVRTVTRRWN